mgnify:CR=1 FL=1
MKKDFFDDGNVVSETGVVEGFIFVLLGLVDVRCVLDEDVHWESVGESSLVWHFCKMMMIIFDFDLVCLCLKKKY